jgi:hypothetical protein
MNNKSSKMMKSIIPEIMKMIKGNPEMMKEA